MKNAIIILLSILFLLPQYTWSQGCMEPSGDDGVTVMGYLQPQYEYGFMGEDLKGNSLNESKFYFNRARVGIMGAIPYDFSYYALAELSPTLGGPYILDAFISYNRFGPWAKISMGQFKSPFGLELGTPCHKLHTIDRSLVVNELAAPFRDIGVMISGGTDTLSIFGSKTKNFFGYSLAVLNGTGKNTLDNNAKKDIVGRLTIHPVEFLTVGASYRFGKKLPLIDGSEDDEISRFGLDLEVKYKNLLLQGEYISGSDVGSYTTGGGCGGDLEVHQGSLDRSGFFFQALYMTPWNIQPVFKLSNYTVPNAENENIDDDKFTMTYGFNYFFNEWTRVQVNYLYNAEKGGLKEIDNDALVLQVQVVF